MYDSSAVMVVFGFYHPITKTVYKTGWALLGKK